MSSIALLLLAVMATLGGLSAKKPMCGICEYCSYIYVNTVESHAVHLVVTMIQISKRTQTFQKEGMAELEIILNAL